MLIKKLLCSTLVAGILSFSLTSAASATTVAELEQQIAPDAASVLKEIKEANKHGDNNKALQLADIIIEKYQGDNPTLIRAYLGKVIAYFALKDIKSARLTCETAYNLDPTYTECEYYMGQVLRKEKNIVRLSLFLQSALKTKGVKILAMCIGGEASVLRN